MDKASFSAFVKIKHDRGNTSFPSDRKFKKCDVKFKFEPT